MPAPAEPEPPAGSRFWRVGAAVAAIMVGLAVFGVGLTTVDRLLARRYWTWLVPAYGLLCMVTAWDQPRDDPGHGLGAVVRQLAHWLTIGGAVAINFWITGTGEEAGAVVGFNALLLLAVGCVLAGVYLNLLLGVVGGLLVLTLLCIVKADQYLWILFLVAVLALVVIPVAARIWGRSAAVPLAKQL